MEKYNKIRAVFEASSNRDIAVQMEAYMRNQFRFYGIKTPVRRAISRDLINADRRSKTIDWEFLDRCWEDEHREMQYFVLDYLRAMQKYQKFDDIPRLQRYIKTKQWWDTIDGLDRIVGNIGLADERVNDLMLSWSTADDIWLRRIAIDHQIGRKEKTNTILLERILLNNLGSSEFFINKAIGWSLREYSKTNPEWVRTFIGKNRDRMSSLSIREASKYL